MFRRFCKRRNRLPLRPPVAPRLAPCFDLCAYRSTLGSKAGPFEAPRTSSLALRRPARFPDRSFGAVGALATCNGEARRLARALGGTCGPCHPERSGVAGGAQSKDPAGPRRPERSDAAGATRAPCHPERSGAAGAAQSKDPAGRGRFAPAPEGACGVCLCVLPVGCAAAALATWACTFGLRPKGRSLRPRPQGACGVRPFGDKRVGGSRPASARGAVASLPPLAEPAGWAPVAAFFGFDQTDARFRISKRGFEPSAGSFFRF